MHFAAAKGCAGEKGVALDRGRHPGFPSFNFFAASPGSLAERYPHGHPRISIAFSESQHRAILGTPAGAHFRETCARRFARPPQFQ